jgi:subtilisin-like proprotein convertase family protein
MKKITSKLGIQLHFMLAIPFLMLCCMLTSTTYAQTSDVEITLTTDNFAGETSWELRDASGTILASLAPGAQASNTTVVTNVPVLCNQTPGAYEFEIFDSFGDGICCGFGSGSYSVFEDGNEIIDANEADGTEFSSSNELTAFATACAPPPCALDNPQAISDFTTVTSVITVTGPDVIGAMTNQNMFSNLLVEAQHDRAGDLVMTLTSPAGTMLDLSSNNGGVDGLDTQDILFFVDGQPNITTWTGAPVDPAGYEPEGGSLMATFAGEPIAGDWTLTILDGGLGDEGTLQNFCLEFTNNGVVGTPPTISCPADIVVNSDEDGAGDCEAMVVFADAAAIDAEDGPIATTQTAGPASGDAFPVGDTDVTFEATDSDGNTVSCTFTVTVIDNEDPVAVCQDITVTLDALGMATITEADIDNGSDDNCPGFTLSLSQTTFGCGDVGDVIVTLTVTDASGNTDTCDATVTVVDDIAPVIACEGGAATFSEDFESPTIPAGWSVVNNATGDSWTFGGTVLGESFGPDPYEMPTLSAILLDDENLSGNGDPVDADLLSPIYDLTGATSAELSFDYNHQSFAGDSDFSVDVWDGAAWQQVFLSEDDDPSGSAGVDFATAGPIDVLAFANADFQVRFKYTESGGLAWGVGVDNFLLDAAIPSAPPLDVVLDVNGMATVNAADLLTTADDACGVEITVPGGITINETGDNLGATITTGAGNEVLSVATIADSGTIGTDITLDNVGIDINHTWASDLDITLTSPAGTVLELTTDNGGSAVDAYIGTIFQDGGADITAATPPFTGTFEPEGGTFAATFAGESITGDWTLTIVDDAGGDDGTLNDFTITFTQDTIVQFSCADVGINEIEVFATDPSGNVSSCIARVNVIDDTAPVLVCQDIDLEIGPDGTATLDPMDLIDMTNSIEACGYDIVTADITDFDCSNVGTPVLVTLFASDPSGNIASCSAMVTATDTTGPTITCPDDVNVSPEPNGVYTLEDFTAAAVAVDNCTDPVTIITQSPAAGTALGVGTYTITISAEDDLGNIGTCDFTLVVDPIQGVNDTAFDAAISMYPNPADNVVTIANKSNIALENAAIYDINGKLVSTIDLAGMQSERTIDVAALASGVYVVQITGENAVTTKRLIKK